MKIVGARKGSDAGDIREDDAEGPFVAVYKGGIAYHTYLLILPASLLCDGQGFT